MLQANFVKACSLSAILDMHTGTFFVSKLECGPLPNVMASQANIGGALCSKPQSLADAHYSTACSNAANTGECKTWTVDAK